MKKLALSILLLIISFGVVIYLSNLFYFRLDFTADKRYTLSASTKNIIDSLESDVFVKVYLTGDELPNGFKRLEAAIKQTLDDIKASANTKVNYRFIDIYQEYKNEDERNKLIAELAQKGINPTNIVNKKDGKSTQLLILPGALISYQNQEVPVYLLKGSKLISPQETLNQATEGVEFELANAFKQLQTKEKKKIGFFVNYTDLPAIKQINLIKLLKKNYDLFPVDLTASPTLDGLDAIFVMQPSKPFADADKFKIDQFIVKGGKALFFLDPVKIDSLGLEGAFAKPNPNNLEDLFFNFGVRLNSNLIKDMQMSAAIPMNVGEVGESANIKLIPWPYFPLINSKSTHPIIRNLDAIYLKYVSSIDTVFSPKIKKTPLLETSIYSQILRAPATLSYNTAAKDFDQKAQSQGNKVVSYLLEGTFASFYKNSILPTDARFANFKAIDKPSKIIICSDADIPTNDVDYGASQPLPLGFDKYSKHTFANADFVKNAVDYLLDPNGVISARSKQVILRPLDKAEVEGHSLKWQIINLTIPAILLGLIWLLGHFYTKRKFS